MSRAATGGGGSEGCRYKGVRRRRWGKWVSEIRVPGTRERLWLGSYATPEAAALAHDAASYLLRGGASTRLNFPERAAEAYGPRRGDLQLSPQSVQRVASDAGMAADAQLVAARESVPAPRRAEVGISNGNGTGIAQGGASARQEESYGTYWCTYEGGGRNSGSFSSSELAANGELSVDDMEIWM